MLILLALLFAEPAAAQPSAEDVAASARAYLAAHRSMRGRFVQTYTSSLGHRLQSRGRFAIASPGRARFDYESPAQIYVSDGDRWTFYQAVEGTAGQHAGGELPPSLRGALGVLSGATVIDRFRLSLRAARADDPPGTDPLVLAPRERDAPVRRIVLLVERATGRIARLSYEDLEHNWNWFDLRDVELDVTLAEDTFRYTPPAGSRALGRAP